MPKKKPADLKDITLAEYCEGYGVKVRLAKAVGCAQGYIGDLAKGNRTCSWKMSRRIAKALADQGYRLTNVDEICGQIEDA